MGKFVTNASSATWWPKLELMLSTLHVGQWWSNFELIQVEPHWPNLEPRQVAFYLAGKITQVTESIPWVRCASGNVYIVDYHSALISRNVHILPAPNCPRGQLGPGPNWECKQL